jgi:hypothetical protein
MKKRLLLVLAIGVSFAPTVWAGDLSPKDYPRFNTDDQVEKNAPAGPHCVAGEIDHLKIYAEESQPGSKQGSGSETSAGSLYSAGESSNSGG